MSVDDQFDLVQKSIQGKAAGSYYTWDTDYQRFINNSGLDGAPNLVDDKTLDSMSGTETFRTTNENRAFPGKAIAVKTQTDDKLLYNAGGQEWYGKGLYSATSLGSSTAYGNNSRAAVMRFKIDAHWNLILPDLYFPISDGQYGHARAAVCGVSTDQRHTSCYSSILPERSQ